MLRVDFDHPLDAVHHASSPGRAANQPSAWSRWPSMYRAPWTTALGSAEVRS